VAKINGPPRAGPGKDNVGNPNILISVPRLWTLPLLLTPMVVFAQGFPPHAAVGRMKVRPGFHVQLVASEPEIRQPILVKFDERGRLWVIQYLQYPNPAGLKRVKVDRYSRTTYDRVPEPPPRGPQGADRITILEDTNGDGRADRFKDFVSGLNLATGLAIGHGGVYVLQVPYLLFYPDRNRDDVPDSDPEVLLEGFGMEDAQSLANHLTWGPDGWLYGLNGSTTTCRIRGVEFQQGVWRYHPVTREFELFAEGGGNIYGLAFDAAGNLFYSSNGSSLFWHAVQGAYYQKSFGKHGPLHNPYAYGYFPHVKHNGVPGGHVVLGGLIYSGTSFAEEFRETFVGGNFLGRSVSWWRVKPRGSTVEAELGGTFFDAVDTWFCPTDLAQAPDGSIYVCDFHDKRTAHPDPDADWDLSNGRVYRLLAAGTKPGPPSPDLARLSSGQLVALLGERNRWYADQARVILAARRDPATHAPLRAMALQKTDFPLALQGLWALHVSGGFNEAVARDLVGHPSEHVRAWTVRLLGDSRKSLPEFAGLARTEPSPVVRAQLAASARRLRAAEALPILNGLWDQNRDAADPHIPMLIWWALEDKAVSDMAAVVRTMATRESWTLASRHDDLRRLGRRWAAEGTRAAYDAAARLIESAPPPQIESLAAAIDLGLAERAGPAVVADTGQFLRYEVVTSPAPAAARKFEPVAGPLLAAVDRLWRENRASSTRTRLAARAGIAEAARHAAAERMLDVLMEVSDAGVIPDLLPLLEDADTRRASAAIKVLARFDDERVFHKLVEQYSRFPAQAQDVLLSRASSARILLDAVDAGRVAPSAVDAERLKRIAAFRDASLDARVRRHRGNISAGTPEEKLATIRRLSNDLRAGTGDADSGRRLYLQHCARCHKLYGTGGFLAMDLTPANRSDRLYLLTHIVDPSAFIRKEYMTLEIRTRDGRLLRGLPAEEDAAAVTLTGADYQQVRIPQSEIVLRQESPVSLMPEGLLEKLNPQQLRDLFVYLMK